MQFLDRVYDLRFLPKFQYRPILAEIGLPCFIVMNPLILARSALLSWSCITSIYMRCEKKPHFSLPGGGGLCRTVTSYGAAYLSLIIRGYVTRFLLIFHMLNALSVLHFLECTEDDTANIRERTANIRLLSSQK